MSRDMEDMLPWQRHDFIMQFHQSSRVPSAPAASATTRTDMDAIRDHHRFIRGDGGDIGPDSSWEERMAARYYKKLVKEYALVDLGRYKEGKVGMRWRTESEVVSGKGQFECASVTCERTRSLRSFEVPFVYREDGDSKRALVKVRVCEECAPKLYWKKTKELEKLSQLLAAHGEDGKDKSPGETGTSRSRKRSRNSPEAKEAQGDRPAHKTTSELRPRGNKRSEKVSDEAVDNWIDELLV